MRWTRAPKPQRNELRVIRRFAWFPVFETAQIIWLEYYITFQQYWGESIWRDISEDTFIFERDEYKYKVTRDDRITPEKE
jgi:hypothetical protein